MEKKIAGLLGSLPVGDDYPVRIVGVINMSPESFYISLGSAEEALGCARHMVENGADALDVGGMSTAPYLETSISTDEEMSRVLPAVRLLAQNLHVPISVDTQRGEVAERALAAGASAVNDVSGRANTRLMKIAADHGSSLIILPEDQGPVTDALDSTNMSLGNKAEMAIGFGMDPSKVIIDPGIGFIRNCGVPWFERDSLIIANLTYLRKVGRPIYVGVSRKSFIGRILALEEPSDRLTGSLAATAVAVFNGAHVIRTHDIPETRQATRLAEALKRRIMQKKVSRS
jgi:dihydropteroate synthase